MDCFEAVHVCFGNKTRNSKKLQEEIDDCEKKDEKSEYDRVHNMVYLDLFVREVLRMYPIAPQAMSRECDATTTICGHTIDKGQLSIQSPCTL